MPRRPRQKEGQRERRDLASAPRWASLFDGKQYNGTSSLILRDSRTSVLVDSS